MWLPFLWQYGAEVFRSVNGRLVSGFDRPEARQAFELLHSLYHIDAIATVQGGVETGVSAMSMEGTWVLGSDFQLDFEWGVYPLPRGPAGAATQSSSNGIAILRDSKNPEAAWKFLKWLGEEGMPHVLATEKFGVPPNVGFAAGHIDQMFGAVPSDADRLTIFRRAAVLAIEARPVLRDDSRHREEPSAAVDGPERNGSGAGDRADGGADQPHPQRRVGESSAARLVAASQEGGQAPIHPGVITR